MTGAEEHTELDLTGLKCPLPVLRTRRALHLLGQGQTLGVTCSDPLSAIDIPHLIREEGDRLEAVETVEGGMRFTIRRSGPRSP